MITRLSALLVATSVALLVVACASSAGSGWTFAPPVETPAASPSGASPGASESAGASGSAAPSGPGGGGTTIAVEETSDLRILRDGQPLTELHVTPGETYTFEVTNTAGFTHDFYIGTAEDLEAANTADLEGVPAFTSGTETFEWTAPDDAPTDLEFACTVPGHYPSMHGTIVFD